MSSIVLPSSSRCIGIMAELTGATSLEPMIDAAIGQLARNGFETLVVSSGSSVRDEQNAWDILARSQCDGLIVHSDCLENDQLARLISTRPNVVLANLNNTQAGKLAATHLANMGHTQLAMVTGPTHRYCVQHMSRGFVSQTMTEHGRQLEFPILSSTLNEEGGADAMNKLLVSVANPTAIFFHNDRMAIGALQVCQQQGIRVPDDISLLGCGNLPESILAKPALSTISQPLKSIGEHAAKRMVSLLDGDSSEANVAANLKWSSPTLMNRYSIADRSHSISTTPDSQISARERECLQWAAKGKTSWEISQILGVTESTIIYHLRNATRKLDAANRLHAVTKALQACIIDF